VNRRLFRSPDDRVLAGVAGGMAETYDLDPAVVRVGWALLILLTGGVFLLLYIVMAIVVPLRPEGMGFAWQQPMGSADGEPGATATTGAPSPTGPAGTNPQPGYGEWRYRRHRHDGSGALVIGLILIVIGGIFLARQFIPAFDTALVWPVVVIGIGILLILGAFARPVHRA
jgi:phage shock protein C